MSLESNVCEITIYNLEAVPGTIIIVSHEFYDLTLDFLGS